MEFDKENIDDNEIEEYQSKRLGIEGIFEVNKE